MNGSTIRYGAFLNEMMSFLLTAAAVFFGVVKPLGDYQRRRRRRRRPTATCERCLSTVPAAATRCPFCTSELVRGVSDARWAARPRTAALLRAAVLLRAARAGGVGAGAVAAGVLDGRARRLPLVLVVATVRPGRSPTGWPGGCCR